MAYVYRLATKIIISDALKLRLGLKTTIDVAVILYFKGR